MSVKVLDGIMGLAVGDAFGVPYEFIAQAMGEIGRAHV